VFFSPNDGQSWARLPGGLPVVPVYDLKIKDSDLVAGTHGRSFWILDDISPLRAGADGGNATRLVPPRTAIRTRLRFGALGSAKHDISFALTFGIAGGIVTVEKPDGTKVREFLDIGENPPNGAIVYYWLSEGEAGPVALTFRDTRGNAIATLRSDDASLPAERRPRLRTGLNRYVWDMRYPGPDKIDASLVSPRNKPLAPDADPQTGPLVVPGQYRVDLTVGSSTSSADLEIIKDPRLATPLEAHQRQFDLLMQLTQSLSSLNGAVNRIRRLTRRLEALADTAGAAHADLADKAKAARASLMEIEGVLVDVHRESPRDVLRHPAGLDDTLADAISLVAMSDTSPTAQAHAVSRELMAKVAGEIAKLEGLIAGDIAALNVMAAERRVAHVTA
jgi:hypothetical protein